ncbi:serine/threonine protein kinase, putative [Plasmodium ovale]|uniref:non-specific serine/threonine protein kinase n=2 Tax=Plasmodium ovale TaxID=36330 RepID=A0A1A8WAF0_PLAOA|nr:cyclin g-associated kinase, putative [Plasmodium ovale curtisi]SBS98648.1 cyclin g-associated kinase, putative [Plasmodium ovale curtisi]SCQ17276.1 serine/threonine protein kinase, putative [Plasmodium ovale]
MLKFRSLCTTLIGGKVYIINGKTVREEKLLSEGAYSFVYLAKDLNTNKKYTIKKTICQDKEKLQMAMKEINILKTLPPHKNIVQYYGSTIISEHNYKIVIMLMEFCEKGNLLHIFEKNKDKIKENHIIKILRDIITGLHFLHTQEIPIIHRDIKLENVLCDKNNVYKICDFCSHSINNCIYPNDLMKNKLYILKEEIERDTTFMYRPPELIDLYANLEISCKVDIWMVGCILYLLLFKIHPFQNNHNLLSIINGCFTIPFNTKYSKRIISILLMTLNKNPRNRIDSTTLLFILQNYADLKSWFMYIPSDIKKRVNQIFEKMNELNLNNKQNELIEISNDKIIDVRISSQKYKTQTSKNVSPGFFKYFTSVGLSSDTFKSNATPSSAPSAPTPSAPTPSASAPSASAPSASAPSASAPSASAPSASAPSASAPSASAPSASAPSASTTSTATAPVVERTPNNREEEEEEEEKEEEKEQGECREVKLISLESATHIASVGTDDGVYGGDECTAIDKVNEDTHGSSSVNEFRNPDFCILDTKMDKMMGQMDRVDSDTLKQNENILQELSMDTELNHISCGSYSGYGVDHEGYCSESQGMCMRSFETNHGEHSHSISTHHSINCTRLDESNFGHFFDPWNAASGADDLFGTSSQKSERVECEYSDFFERDFATHKKDINLGTIGNFSNSFVTVNHANSFVPPKCIGKSECDSDACYNIDYFEQLDDDGKFFFNFDFSKSNTERDYAYNSKNCLLNDIKDGSSSKLITSDKNDKFSELLDEFQKLSIK